MNKKYRIVQVIRNNDVYYVIKIKHGFWIFSWWNTLRYSDGAIKYLPSFESAHEKLKNIIVSKSRKDIVIAEYDEYMNAHDDPYRFPYPKDMK
jgi:hypothetical protein